MANVAWPEPSTPALPKTVAPSLKVTEPVGTPIAGATAETVAVKVTDCPELDGFGDDREIDWRTHLERGSNLLSVPVVARSAGPGRLIAVVEHDGRTRQVAIDLAVVEQEQRT